MHTRQTTAAEDYITINGQRISSSIHPAARGNETAELNMYTHLRTDNRDYLSIYACVDRIEEAPESSLILSSNTTTND